MHGRGIGRKLVEVVTDQADREGMSCYLESSKEVPNIRIYEKLGFVLAGGLDCDDNGAVCKVCITTFACVSFSPCFSPPAYI